MAEVRLIHVGKTFDGVVAVEDFNLDIRDGEFLILVGPSGCGKSTVLRSIAGLEEITAGEIYIEGRLINDVHPKDRDIAMVFQNYALYPHMNVYDNMAFSLKQRKMGREEIRRIVESTSELLGIRELLDRKPRQLSGGQRQRVALGRSIVRCPKVFLFDEPLSNLDAKLRIAMRAELLDLHQKIRTTSIYVTHDQVEAMTMGDRLVVMNRGRIQQVDTPQKLYDAPVNRFVAGFIGSPPMNFVDCELVVKGAEMAAVSETLNLPVTSAKAEVLAPHAGKKVTLGLRPEHILEPRSEKPESMHSATFKASVWVVEPLGSEKYVHLRNGQNTLVARLGSDFSHRIGESAEFIANMDKAYFFDAHTGLAIS
ncbi:MAG: glycerol-3-phosphate ABC transporter ATP-binding protein [Deltaproteobacteria bacterium HGW-Deltaproteobacteria-21]|nr:MAG: glycerol-3-phosphate ABC transporter ATP-binding protein [Deltaproteobacteria bacterium HGW-Deltaproteobacteria-21]